MAGTDLTPYQEDDPNKDLTYYGNGCSVDGGSKKPGSTRIVETYDNENQAMGTYYDYQAAASGSGGTDITTDNTNASDTFCPLGWQMPYAGTGGVYYDKSKSWSYLFSIYNYNNNQAGVEGILSYPLSNIQAGNIYWPTITLYDMTIMSRLWSTTNSADWGAYRLSVHLEGKNYLIGTGGKGNGHSVRCILVFDFSPTARWQEQMLNLVIQIGYTTILITEMDVQTIGLNLYQTMVSRTSPVRRARSRQMMETKKLVHITILAQLQSTQIGHCTKIKMLPILSVLLVGNCLTVARVGIIMNSLGLSIILLMNMESKIYQLDAKKKLQ